MLCRYFGFMVTLAFITPTASAQIHLKQTIPQDGKQQFSINKKITQTLTINKNDISSAVEEHALLEAKYDKRGEDGQQPIEYRYAGWQADVDVNGDKVHFDAANPEEGASDSPIAILLDGYRLAASKPFTIVLDENQQVTEFRGWDEILRGLDDKSAALHRDLFDADYLRSIWAAEFNRLPDKSVNKNDTWQRTVELRLHGGHGLTFTQRYTYTGSVKRDGIKYERITIETTKAELRLAADDGPLVIADSDLKVAESEGELLFDPAREQVALIKEKIHIQGELTFRVTANDQQLPGKVDATIESDNTLLP